ncbi:MAG: AI-2E family transporter [Arachnia sp.]
MSQEQQAVPTPRQRGRIHIARPLSIGFAATVGGLIAIGLAGALGTLSTVLVTIGVALFVAMALEPMIGWLERRKLGRGAAIAVVFLVLALILAVLLALVIPVAVIQITELVTAFPGYLTSLQDQGWFQRIIAASGQSDLYEQLLTQAKTWLSDPSNLAVIGGGALAVGSGIIGGVSGALLVLVLTLYFLGSMDQMKKAVVRLSPAHARPQVSRVTDQLTESVGSYVSGMAILAVCNAVVSFLLLTVLSVPFAALLGAMALLVTMIPMIGSVLQWVIASLVALFTVGWIGLVFVGVYFAYMQLEAYVLTPRVMNKAVSIPGALVLISAMVGAALLGLLGALIAVPVTASILMVINEVVVPRQDAKVDAEA